jgi:hypothetical protein
MIPTIRRETPSTWSVALTRRGAAEAPPPEPVGEHDHRLGVGFLVGLLESPSVRGRDPQDREDAGRGCVPDRGTV